MNDRFQNRKEACLAYAKLLVALDKWVHCCSPGKQDWHDWDREEQLLPDLWLCDLQVNPFAISWEIQINIITWKKLVYWPYILDHF